MKIVKYPERCKYLCDICGTEYVLSKSDFNKGRLNNKDGIYTYTICPVCKKEVHNTYNTIIEIGDNIDKIFESKAVEINGMPANQNRKEISHHLNELYESVNSYIRQRINEDYNEEK